MALLRGYLYVIVDKERQFANIGMSRDVRSRLRQLQSACPLSLEVVGNYPCTYVRFREARVHSALRGLSVQNGWFRWDEARIKAATDEVLAIETDAIKFALDKVIQRQRVTDYPVQRLDTGEVFPSSKAAAIAVFGLKKLAIRIRQAVKHECKCGPCFWGRVGEYKTGAATASRHAAAPCEVPKPSPQAVSAT
jgi:hypothetical protein